MATIVLVSMVAAAGVSVAQPATVGAAITGAPAVCYDGANVWYVAQGGAATTSDNIYYQENTAGWIGPIGLGTNPTVVCQGGVGDVAIFVRGTNGGLYERTTADGGAAWSSWAAWPGTVAAGSGPAAVYATHARFTLTPQTDVFYVDSVSHHLMWDSQVNGIITQTDLGGYVIPSPGAAINSAGYPLVFVRGGDGSLYEKADSREGFGNWSTFPTGELAEGTAPTATVGANGYIYVFVQGATGNVYMAYSLDSGSTWSSWLNLGGAPTSSPSAAYAISDTVVTVRGGDGGIWTDTGYAPATVISAWHWSTTSLA